MTLAEKALEFIKDGDVVGLGSGRAAMNFVRALGARVQAGLRVQGVPTSRMTEDLALQFGIPLTTLDAVKVIDIAVDGADEVDPQCNLIKGYGGALVREKIVAAAAERLVILVGVEKIVPVLGSRGKLPVEVLPFGVAPCRRRLLELCCQSRPRRINEDIFTTDNGNLILDCEISAIHNPAACEQQILAIPGVVGTGLFLGMAPTVLIQDGETVHVREPGSP